MLFLIPIGLTLGETLLAAAASAVFGYGAKSAYDHFTDRDETEFNRGKAHGEQRAKAEHEEKLRRFAQAMGTRMADSKTCFDVILAVMTVGYAYAAAHDGKVTDAKRTEIAEFVIGQSQGYLPSYLQTTLNAIAANPPDAATAYAAVMVLAPTALPICDMLIAILDDDQSTPRATQGHKFAAVWNQQKYAA